MNSTYKSLILRELPPEPPSRMCGCIGPQNGEPLCPCRMQAVKIKNGRYVETIDHGPAD